MEKQYWTGFALVLLCCLLEVSSRPSNNESTTSVILEVPVEATATGNTSDNKEERSVSFEHIEEQDDNTKEILEKIKTINEALQKPYKQQINFNRDEPQTGGGYILDKETLEKIQQIIASGKLHPLSVTHKHQESNAINNENENYIRFGNAKALKLASLPSNPILANQGAVALAPLSYIANIPVIITPSMSDMYGGYTTNNDLNAIDPNTLFQTRQKPPSLPFNIQWPLAPYFPILIKDPLVGFLHGGGWGNFVEYGQNADVCSRKQKSVGTKNSSENDDENTKRDSDVEDFLEDPMADNNSRQGRSMKKRKISQSTLLQDLEENKSKKFFKPLHVTTEKPIKKTPADETTQNKKTVLNDDDSDLRFSWFSNKKPAVPSPGFFINRLKVRRGGVAIAGPGGVATAGRGGTAIVGPGGLAYTQPGSLAVAGPAARVVALTSDADLSSVVSRLQEQSANDGSVPRLLEAIPEGKVVATGPVVYYHPKEYYRGGWRSVRRDDRWQNSGFSSRSDKYQYNGASFVKGPLRLNDSTFMLFLKPVAHAITSSKGVAVANPISQVVIAKDQVGSVVHTPVAAAVAGPGGIAHAQSDLDLPSVQYIPFYGGAKGQYLEVKKDNAGTVVSETIVSEENISSENIVKNSNENLLSKVLAANLKNLQTLSNNLIKLHNLGRKTGFLGNNEKNRFKNQLSSLGDTASNTVKLIEEVGDNIDILFRSNATNRQITRQEYDDDVGEEGVGIDSPTNEDSEILGGSLIAEAKPVGLAVVGENGLAASRPMATAVAISGVAIARPIATAIAGVDPSALGINIQVNPAKH